MKKSRKRKIKNNSFRKNYRKKRKKYRKTHRTKYRKNLKKPRKNKTHKKKLSGGMVASSISEQEPSSGTHRIGLELEACFKGEREPGTRPRKLGRKCWAIQDFNELTKLFTKELQYFHAYDDDSIRCSNETLCRMELVLREDDKVFNYNGRRIYMNGSDITSVLFDELSLILSKAEPCFESWVNDNNPGSSCGFHVHISETDPKYALDQKNGKIFLLRALALWCGIDGLTDGEQTKFIDKGYARPDNKQAELLSPLDETEFKRVYNLSLTDNLTDEELLDYIIKVYEIIPNYSEWGPKYRVINLYFFGLCSNDIAEVKENAKSKMNEILRIEFRGHKDLIERLSEVAGETTPKDYLINYLEEISSFFERAKTYEPPI